VKGRQNSVIQPKKGGLSYGHKSSKQMSDLMDGVLLEEAKIEETIEKDHNSNIPVKRLLEPVIEL